MIEECHEKMFVSFVRADKKKRYTDLVSSKKGRKKLLDEMNTLSKYIDVHTVLVELGSEDECKAMNMLQEKNSPEKVYVFSDENEFDRKFVALDEAVSIAFESSFITIVSCIPGKLALVVSNESDERYIVCLN